MFLKIIVRKKSREITHFYEILTITHHMTTFYINITYIRLK